MGVFVGVDVAGMMVTFGGGKVGARDAGADKQADKATHSRETIRVVRDIGELYCLKVTVTLEVTVTWYSLINLALSTF